MSFLKNSLVIPFLILLSAGILTACDWQSARRTITLQDEMIGITYAVKYLSGGLRDLLSPERVKSQLDLLLEEADRQMSIYHEDSEINHFNKMREAGRPMSIATDFAAVAAEAVHLDKATHGALDVTVGPLVDLWGFGSDEQLTYSPSAEEIKQVPNAVGIDKISLSHDNGSAILVKSRPEVYLDLPSIAKGFDAGKLALYLENLGIHSYLMGIGDEPRDKGRNVQGEPWCTGTEQSRLLQGGDTQIIMPLDNRALAMSGDYHNFHTDKQGRRLSYIINPQKIEPISHNLASISVVADTAMTADGLSTGPSVLGEEEALALAEQQGLAVFLIIRTRDGYRTGMSSKFKQLIR